MAQTSLTIRIDEELKKDAEALFNRIGLNLSSAINIFFRQAVGAQAIPFELKAYNNYVDMIKESVQQADERKLIPLSIEEIESMNDMSNEDIKAFLLSRRKDAGL